MGTVERFRQYLDFKGISNHKAEIDCGLSNGLIKNAIKAGSCLGSDKLENILNTYTDLSAEWLLRGVGSMLLSENNQPNKYYEMCKMILENKRRENDLYSKVANMMGE